MVGSLSVKYGFDLEFNADSDPTLRTPVFNPNEKCYIKTNTS